MEKTQRLLGLDLLCWLLGLDHLRWLLGLDHLRGLLEVDQSPRKPGRDEPVTRPGPRTGH